MSIPTTLITLTAKELIALFSITELKPISNSVSNDWQTMSLLDNYPLSQTSLATVGLNIQYLNAGSNDIY